jgi:hypothetical protein
MDCDVPSRTEKLLKFKLRLDPEKAYWVQCKGCRCLAIPAPDGKWLCFATGKELTDIIQVYPD